MKILVDRAKCTGLGICESIAPDLFEVDDNGDLELKAQTVDDSREADVQAAVEGCPTAALRRER